MVDLKVFCEGSLLQRALTHKSFSQDHNERLEFLGDALLDLIIGEALYHKFPNQKEGVLSRYRAELVKGEALAHLAREIDISDQLRLGSGEEKTGGRERESILAGAFEAVIGAVYLSKGMQTCTQLVMQLFASRLENIEHSAKQKDPKTSLQELLQAKKLPLPKYQVVSTEGLQHQQRFTVCLKVAELGLEVEAQAESKKKAEQAVAEKMLSLLHSENK